MSDQVYCFLKMTLFKNRYRIESARLRNHDYSQPGAYFITICTNNRECLFGNVENGKMILNDAGNFVKKCWFEIPTHYPNIALDAFVIMPNHIHGIIVINKKNDTGTVTVETNDYSSLPSPGSDASPGSDEPHTYAINHNFRSPSKTVGSVVRGFKIGVTKWFRMNTRVYDVWQSNYYEHIIRNTTEFYRIRRYIINNPANWQKDNQNR